MFEDVEIEWQGVKHVIKGTTILPLIAQIEDEAATVFEICTMYAKGKPKGTVIAKALSVVLRYVGVTVPDDVVYASVVRGQATTCLVTLINIMAPPPDPSGKKQEAPEAAPEPGRL